MRERETLVMLRPLGLGDFLTGVPAYRALARGFPDHRRILVAPKPLHQLVPLVGGIDETVDLGPLEPLPEALHRADIAVDLHGKGPASHQILVAARPKRLIAFRNGAIPESLAGAEWFAGEHEVNRWCRMLAHAGIAVDPGDLDLHPPALTMPARFAEATIVHPGAASASRRWPIERWAKVVRFALASGERVLLSGGPHEAELTSELALRGGLSPTEDLGGRTTLLELASVVARAARVVCADTGMAHLATALRVPSVVLFGPTAPSEWGPPPERYWHRVLWAGWTGDPHGNTIDSGLLTLTPRQVIGELERLPGRASLPRTKRNVHVTVGQ